MAWKKLDSVSLTSAGDNIENDIVAKKFMQILSHLIDDNVGTGEDIFLTFDDDTGNNYNYRAAENGNADSTRVNQPKIQQDFNIIGTVDHFFMDYVDNISGEETLLIGFTMGAGAPGATNAPERLVITAKYTGHIDDKVEVTNSALTGSYDTDSNLTTLGTD